MKKIILMLAGLTMLIINPASGESSYRYWSYWLQMDGVWISASAGAAATPVVDGSVQGWRFVATGAALDETAEPSINPSFAEICGNTQSSADVVRMGIVIDYGTAADAGMDITPPQVETHCVEISTTASSMQALVEVVDLREEAGFVCALNSYPEVGCGESVEVVDKVEPVSGSDTESQTDPSSLAPFAIGLFISAGLFWILKKRGNKQ
jgi:hypothetical protein